MAKDRKRTADEAGPDDDFERFKRWFRRDIVKTNKWRKEAKEDFQFRDGDQWSKDDKQKLADEGRPVIVFNRTGVLVDAVVGVEVGNRREVRYIPRDVNDSKPNEMLTSAAEWFRDLCDAEDEESEAFKDTVTAGMGWTETRLDRKDNPEGEPKIERLDPFEMAWDCNATKANLVDSRRRWRVRKMDIREAEKLFPDVASENLNAAWAEGEEDGEPHENNPTQRYSHEVDGEQDDLNRQVTIVACQYLEDQPYYKALILTPPAMEPQVVDLDPEKFKIAEKAGAVLQSAKLTKQTVMQCFLGRTILKKPMPTQTGMFTWNCMTGLADQDKGIFYGIVRRAKDPQRWANKWLSQILHILNSQAKGGIIAERDVAEDQTEFEESWARTDRITWARPGKLTAGKIEPKPMAQFPAGFDRLMAYADEVIVKATGINMELLGIREVNQPGVLEYQRKQSGMGILATFFDSMKRYRKIQGRVMLKLIQDYLSDGRMVRILGDDEAQYVPLTKTADIEYDIIVDDAPTSPNDKEKNWQIIQSFLPMVKDALGPAQILVLAKYSPLPQSFIEDIKRSMAQGQEQNPAQQMAAQVEQAKMALEADKLKLEMAKIQSEREKTALEMQKMGIDAQTSMMEQETERQRLGVDRIEAFAHLAEAQNPKPVIQSRPH